MWKNWKDTFDKKLNSNSQYKDIDVWNLVDNPDNQLLNNFDDLDWLWINDLDKILNLLQWNTYNEFVKNIGNWDILKELFSDLDFASDDEILRFKDEIWENLKKYVIEVSKNKLALDFVYNIWIPLLLKLWEKFSYDDTKIFIKNNLSNLDWQAKFKIHFILENSDVLDPVSVNDFFMKDNISYQNTYKTIILLSYYSSNSIPDDVKDVIDAKKNWYSDVFDDGDNIFLAKCNNILNSNSDIYVSGWDLINLTDSNLDKNGINLVIENIFDNVDLDMNMDDFISSSDMDDFILDYLQLSNSNIDNLWNKGNMWFFNNVKGLYYVEAIKKKFSNVFSKKDIKFIQKWINISYWSNIVDVDWDIDQKTFDYIWIILFTQRVKHQDWTDYFNIEPKKYNWNLLYWMSEKLDWLSDDKIWIVMNKFMLIYSQILLSWRFFEKELESDNLISDYFDNCVMFAKWQIDLNVLTLQWMNLMNSLFSLKSDNYIKYFNDLLSSINDVAKTDSIDEKKQKYWDILSKILKSTTLSDNKQLREYYLNLFFNSMVEKSWGDFDEIYSDVINSDTDNDVFVDYLSFLYKDYNTNNLYLNHQEVLNKKRSYKISMIIEISSVFYDYFSQKIWKLNNKTKKQEQLTIMKTKIDELKTILKNPDKIDYIDLYDVYLKPIFIDPVSVLNSNVDRWKVADLTVLLNNLDIDSDDKYRSIRNDLFTSLRDIDENDSFWSDYLQSQDFTAILPVLDDVVWLNNVVVMETWASMLWYLQNDVLNLSVSDTLPNWADFNWVMNILKNILTFDENWYSKDFEELFKYVQNDVEKWLFLNTWSNQVDATMVYNNINSYDWFSSETMSYLKQKFSLYPNVNIQSITSNLIANYSLYLNKLENERSSIISWISTNLNNQLSNYKIWLENYKQSLRDKWIDENSDDLSYWVTLTNWNIISPKNYIWYIETLIWQNETLLSWWDIEDDDWNIMNFDKMVDNALLIQKKIYVSDLFKNLVLNKTLYSNNDMIKKIQNKKSSWETLTTSEEEIYLMSDIMWLWEWYNFSDSDVELFLDFSKEIAIQVAIFAISWWVANVIDSSFLKGWQILLKWTSYSVRISRYVDAASDIWRWIFAWWNVAPELWAVSLLVNWASFYVTSTLLNSLVYRDWDILSTLNPVWSHLEFTWEYDDNWEPIMQKTLNIKWYASSTMFIGLNKVFNWIAQNVTKSIVWNWVKNFEWKLIWQTITLPWEILAMQWTSVSLDLMFWDNVDLSWDSWANAMAIIVWLKIANMPLWKMYDLTKKINNDIIINGLSTSTNWLKITWISWTGNDMVVSYELYEWWTLIEKNDASMQKILELNEEKIKLSESIWKKYNSWWFDAVTLYDWNNLSFIDMEKILKDNDNRKNYYDNYNLNDTKKFDDLTNDEKIEIYRKVVFMKTFENSYLMSIDEDIAKERIISEMPDMEDLINSQEKITLTVTNNDYTTETFGKTIWEWIQWTHEKWELFSPNQKWLHTRELFKVLNIYYKWKWLSDLDIQKKSRDFVQYLLDSWYLWEKNNYRDFFEENELKIIDNKIFRFSNWEKVSFDIDEWSQLLILNIREVLNKYFSRWDAWRIWYIIMELWQNLNKYHTNKDLWKKTFSMQIVDWVVNMSFSNDFEDYFISKWNKKVSTLDEISWLFDLVYSLKTLDDFRNIKNKKLNRKTTDVNKNTWSGLWFIECYRRVLKSWDLDEDNVKPEDIFNFSVDWWTITVNTKIKLSTSEPIKKLIDVSDNYVLDDVNNIWNINVFSNYSLLSEVYNWNKSIWTVYDWYPVEIRLNNPLELNSDWTVKKWKLSIKFYNSSYIDQDWNISEDLINSKNRWSDLLFYLNSNINVDDWKIVFSGMLNRSVNWQQQTVKWMNNLWFDIFSVISNSLHSNDWYPINDQLTTNQKKLSTNYILQTKWYVPVSLLSWFVSKENLFYIFEKWWQIYYYNSEWTNIKWSDRDWSSPIGHEVFSDSSYSFKWLAYTGKYLNKWNEWIDIYNQKNEIISYFLWLYQSWKISSEIMDNMINEISVMKYDYITNITWDSGKTLLEIYMNWWLNRKTWSSKLKDDVSNKFWKSLTPIQLRKIRQIRLNDVSSIEWVWKNISKFYKIMWWYSEINNEIFNYIVSSWYIFSFSPNSDALEYSLVIGSYEKMFYDYFDLFDRYLQDPYLLPNDLNVLYNNYINDVVNFKLKYWIDDSEKIYDIFSFSWDNFKFLKENWFFEKTWLSDADLLNIHNLVVLKYMDEFSSDVDYDNIIDFSDITLDNVKDKWLNMSLWQRYKFIYDNYSELKDILGFEINDDLYSNLDDKKFWFPDLNINDKYRFMDLFMKEYWSIDSKYWPVLNLILYWLKKSNSDFYVYWNYKIKNDFLRNPYSDSALYNSVIYNKTLIQNKIIVDPSWNKKPINKISLFNTIPIFYDSFSEYLEDLYKYYSWVENNISKKINQYNIKNPSSNITFLAWSNENNIDFYKDTYSDFLPDYISNIKTIEYNIDNNYYKAYEDNEILSDLMLWDWFRDKVVLFWTPIWWTKNCVKVSDISYDWMISLSDWTSMLIYNVIVPKELSFVIHKNKTILFDDMRRFDWDVWLRKNSDWKYEVISWFHIVDPKAKRRLMNKIIWDKNLDVSWVVDLVRSTLEYTNIDDMQEWIQLFIRNARNNPNVWRISIIDWIWDIYSKKTFWSWYRDIKVLLTILDSNWNPRNTVEVQFQLKSCFEMKNIWKDYSWISSKMNDYAKLTSDNIELTSDDLNMISNYYSLPERLKIKFSKWWKDETILYSADDFYDVSRELIKWDPKQVKLANKLKRIERILHESAWNDMVIEFEDFSFINWIKKPIDPYGFTDQ